MKKDETRFTIRFNPTDPRQRKATEVLVAAGRRKASLIADALCEYLASYDNDEIIVKTIPTVNSATVNNNTTAVLTGETVLDDDMREAVLGGLSMFSTE
jgi:hypothetical protein